MVQQVNGAFHFLLYKSLVLTLTFFKMVLKHSVETHTFEEGVVANLKGARNQSRMLMIQQNP